MLTLLLPALSLAATVTAPDGTFSLDAPGYQSVSPTAVSRGREAFRVEAVGARNPGDLGVLDFLRGFAAQNDAGVQVYTWAGESEGRAAGCLDTRRTTEGLRVEIHTWCGVRLPDGRVAVLRMDSRDPVRGRSFGKATQQLLDGVSPLVVAAPEPSPVATEPAPAAPAEAPADLALPAEAAGP